MNRLAHHSLWGFVKVVCLYFLLAVGVFAVIGNSISTVFAQPSYTINYQGKLTDNTGLTVPNGTYEIEFNLYTQSTGGVAIWTETRSGGNEVTVENGLFSVMLGSVSSLAGVNFNQPLYLGVTIEADAEMTPRKVIGSVPSAMEAKQLGGVASSSFLRSDQADTASGLLTFSGGFISGASSTISTLNASSVEAYAIGAMEVIASNLTVNGETFNDLTGTGLTNNSGVLSVATSTLGLSAAFSNSAQLAALLSNETGTGLAVFNNSPVIYSPTLTSVQIGSEGVRISDDGDGTIIFRGLGNGADEDLSLNLDDTADTGVFGSGTGLNLLTFSNIGLSATNGTFSSTLSLSGTAANIALGSNWLSGDGGDEGIFVDGSGNVGIGTTTGSGAALTIEADGFFQNGLLVDTTGADVVVGGYTTGLSVNGGASVGGYFTNGPYTVRIADNNAYTSGVYAGDGTSVGALAFSNLFVSAAVYADGGGGYGFYAPEATDINYFAGSVGIGTSSPASKLTVAGDLRVTGALKDSSGDAGTNGQVLLSTGSGINWTATSSIGFSAAFTNSAQLAALLSDETGSGGGFVRATSPTIATPTFTTSAIVPLIIGGSATSQQLILRSSSGNATTDDIIFQMGNNGGTQWGRLDNENNSIAFGESAGTAFVSGAIGNIAIGYQAGQNASTSDNDGGIFIGSQAGQNNTQGENIIIGRQAGQHNKGFSNNLIGYLAGQNNTGNYNDIFGYYAGNDNTGSQNLLIGSNAGHNNTGSNNVFLGPYSGYLSQGSNNILIGDFAADNMTTGNNNIVIGYNIDNVTATADNVLNIGNLIFGTGLDGTGTTLASGRVGIGSSTPSAKLMVQGSNDTSVDVFSVYGGANTFGNGGNINLYAGGAPFGGGGDVTVSAGGGDAGGEVSVLGGSGGSFGGGVSILGGDGGSGGGGNVYLTAGDSDFDSGGSVYINAGAGTGGVFGDPAIILNSTGNGNVGIGDSSPASLFTVGSGDLFQINSSGVIVSNNNLTPDAILSTGQADEECLTYESTGDTFEWQSCGSAPGGSDTQIQFNDGGSLAGDAGFTYNKTTDTLNLKSLSVGGGGTVYFDDGLTFSGGYSIDNSGNAWFNSVVIDGALLDYNTYEGAQGMVLQSRGDGIEWVATSSLGIAASIAADSLDFDDFADAMTLDDDTNIAVSSTNSFSITGATNGTEITVTDGALYLTDGGSLSISNGTVNTDLMNANYGQIGTFSDDGNSGSLFTASVTINGITSVNDILTVSTANQYAAALTVQNDGNNVNRVGLLIQAGLDDHTATGPSQLIQFSDGNGGSVGTIGFGSSSFQIDATGSQHLRLGTNTSTGDIYIGNSSDVVYIDGTLGVADIEIMGALFDDNGSTGSNGMLLMSTGSNVEWVATSSLGISGGGGIDGSGVANQMAIWSDSDTLTSYASFYFNGTAYNITNGTNYIQLGVNGATALSSNLASGYTGRFINDGNNTNRYGLLVQAGLDDHSAIGTSKLIQFNDGDGGSVGSIGFGGGALTIDSATNVLNLGSAISIIPGLNIDINSAAYFYDYALFQDTVDFAEDINIGDVQICAACNGGSIYFGSYARIDEDWSYISAGNFSLGTTSVPYQLTVDGDTFITGALRDSSGDPGTNGQILISTNTGTNWVATSSLGISGGSSSLFTDGGANTYLTATGDNLSIGGTGGSAKLNVYGNLDIANGASGISFMGTRMFYASTTNDSIAIGEGAGATFTSGTTENVAIGYLAGGNVSNVNADGNVLIGYYAGYANSSYDNVILGTSAGRTNTGDNNAIIGFWAGYSNTGTTNNMFGNGAGYENTGNRNNLFGYEAGLENQGSYNNIFGSEAGHFNVGDYNNFFGTQSGQYNEGSHNNFFGFSAGKYSSTSSDNNFIGTGAGELNAGNDNNFIGTGAGSESIGSDNVFIGSDAGFYNIGDYNNLIGNGAGYQNEGSFNNAIGWYAGAENAGDYNNFLGVYAGYYVTGNYNTVIGYQAAFNLTSGNRNIVIGHAIDAVSATANDTLNIGNIIFGTGIDGTGSTLSSGNIGIGTTTPSKKFSVAANVANYAAVIFNDGNSENRTGLLIQAGRDDHTFAAFNTLIGFKDGDGTDIGSIQFGNGSVSYNTTSDRRLKENIVTTSLSIEQLMQIQVRDYTWKADGEHKLTHGFIAQELYEIYPNAVSRPNPNDPNSFWQVDYSKLTPLIIAGIQDQQGIIEEQSGALSSLGASLLQTIQSVADLEAMVSGSLSEYYTATDNSLEAGDLVMLDTAGSASILKATAGTSLFGVVTEGNGITLGEGGATSKPIALTGRTQVKVNNEGGDIEVGDAITLSSEAGVGTRATTTARVIGTALETFDDSAGTILVFIEPRTHYVFNEPAMVASLFAPIDNDEEDTLWNRITTLASNFVDGVLNVAGIKTQELCVGSVCVDEETFLEIVEQAGEEPVTQSPPPQSSDGGENNESEPVVPTTPTEPEPESPPLVMDESTAEEEPALSEPEEESTPEPTETPEPVTP